VVANTTRAEGRWSTLDSRSIHRHAKTAGYLYHAELRHRISHELGLAWGPVEKGTAEIQGIDERPNRSDQTTRTSPRSFAAADAICVPVVAGPSRRSGPRRPPALRILTAAALERL
jgi:hypothetical protein